MTTARRLLQMPARLGAHASAATRRRALSLALMAATGITLLIAAAPAGAIVTKVGSATVGLQPRNVETVATTPATQETFDNFSGNPVMHSNSTYVIYWDPTDHYHGDWQHLIDTFLHDVGSDSGDLSNVFAVDAQYTDRTNQPASYRSTFKGAFTDTTRYPTPGCKAPNPLKPADQIITEGKPSCLTKEQVQEELLKFIAQHSLPKGMGNVYYLLTPPGVSDCIDGGEAAEHCSNYSGAVGGASYNDSFCSYHGDINPGGLETGDGNTVLYAAIPWTAGGLGDGHLVPSDHTPAYDCQDGGFDASSERPIEKKESKKVKSANEIKAFEEKNPEEKLAQEEAEALEEPHQQEPNQQPCPNPDGFCDTGLADLIINQIAVEQQNVVTNPLLNAWQDSAHNEATDECRNFFAPVTAGGVTANLESGAGTLSNQSINGDKYYLNTAFNRAASRLPYPGVPCMPGVDLEPLFTAPNQVNSGELVSFDGMESDITLNATIAFPPVGERQTTYATYTWNFGDGSPTVSGYAPGAPTLDSPETTPCEAPWLAPCAASTFHAYQYGGTYDVTLTVKDVGGDVASVSKEITVAGPPPPSPAPSPATPGSTTGSTSAGTTTSGAGTTTNGATNGAGSHAKPVATQAIVSQTLASALRGGVAVRYSVNEQVAGHFEVLIASSTARKLGVKGARATGLAAGVAAQTVIGKAVLVTTKGGRSTYKILLSKTTSSHLRRARTLPLMVRLAVHNSAGGTATVVSTGKLSH